MHLHTRYSDVLTRIPRLLSHAEKHGIGVAITDHTEIRGALEACADPRDILVIPGIELETREGPHLLVYFYTPGDLEDFFGTYTRERNRRYGGLPGSLTVSECLILAGSFDCLRVAAHPFGYFGINRGVLKCVEKEMLPGVLPLLDGIEVICGGMSAGLNGRAVEYAQRHPVPFTGGSDAHILADVGNVLTGAEAGTVEEFLTAVRRRENVVMGASAGVMHKGATAGVIAWSFVPYTVSTIGAYCSVHSRRRPHLISRYRECLSALRGRGEQDRGSEERGEDPRN